MNLLEEKPHGLAAKVRAEGHAAGGPGGGATVDCRSEESVLNGEVNLRIGLPEVGSLHVGASTGAHGGSRENTFQPGEGRCRTPPQAAEVSPQPLDPWRSRASLFFTNGHPGGGLRPTPAISQQSTQFCKASNFRAYHVPFLPGKGLFTCFYESYYIAL